MLDPANLAAMSRASAPRRKAVRTVKRILCTTALLVLSIATAPAPTAASSDATDAPAPIDPNGAISLFDAINKQLGLKLEKQRRPVPSLVIDHMEEKPTEN